MIRVICPGCGSKLNAKDELVGQNCANAPKCARPVVIVAEPGHPAYGSAASQSEKRPQAKTAPLALPPWAPPRALPTVTLPDRLNRTSHYLICDRALLMATWENDGSGWQVRAGGGFSSAKRNRENLPSQGDFKLVELRFTTTPDGKRLVGLTIYQLAPYWAVTALAQNDDTIIEKISGYGCLNQEQKNAVRQSLRDQFMREVWSDAATVL